MQGTIRRTVGLLGEDPIFEQPPLHPAILPLIEGVLGTGCLLTLYDALDITPGTNKQPLHNDDALMPLVRPHQPLVCTTIWALTDFTEENGATRVFPGSHKRPDMPDYAKYAGEDESGFFSGADFPLDGASAVGIRLPGNTIPGSSE